MKRILIFLFILILGAPLFAKKVCIPEKQYDKIIDQLEDNRQALLEDDLKWEQVRKETPQIDYNVNGNNVTQKITIPVTDDNPLEYQTEFQIIPLKEGWMPIKFRLLGAMDTNFTTFTPDAKLGIKFFSFSPILIPGLQNLGLNVLVGLNSSNISLSYDLPKPINNSALHIYTGFSYGFDQVYGIGFSLNF